MDQVGVDTSFKSPRPGGVGAVRLGPWLLAMLCHAPATRGLQADEASRFYGSAHELVTLNWCFPQHCPQHCRLERPLQGPIARPQGGPVALFQGLVLSFHGLMDVPQARVHLGNTRSQGRFLRIPSQRCRGPSCKAFSRATPNTVGSLESRRTSGLVEGLVTILGIRLPDGRAPLSTAPQRATPGT